MNKSICKGHVYLVFVAKTHFAFHLFKKKKKVCTVGANLHAIVALIKLAKTWKTENPLGIRKGKTRTTSTDTLSLQEQDEETMPEY